MLNIYKRLKLWISNICLHEWTLWRAASKGCEKGRDFRGGPCTTEWRMCIKCKKIEERYDGSNV